jgi:hypothetical protein
MKNILLLIVVAISLTSCATTPPRLHELEIGMTKAEAAAVMERRPDHYAAQGRREVLGYKLSDQEYMLGFEDGKLDKYGPAETFLSPEHAMQFKEMELTRQIERSRGIQRASESMQNFSNSLRQPSNQQQHCFSRRNVFGGFDLVCN